MASIRSTVLLALLASSAILPAKESLVFFGTYTRGDSKGIYAYRFDDATGKLTSVGLVAETPNPSFLTIHPNRRFLYAVNELDRYNGQPGGSVSAFAIDAASGKLKALNTVATKGSAPCALLVDKTGKNLLVANYGSGSVAVFPIKADGSLAESSSFVQHSGNSVHARQRGPHAHSVNLSKDNKFAIFSDLGMDEVVVYRFDASKSTITPNNPPFVKVKAGSGPRHFALHPKKPFAYGINELGSTVTTYKWAPKTGELTVVDYASTLPSDFSGNSTTAEIEVHPSGKFVYGSNRGHDSIAVFSIDQTKGTVTRVENTSTQGRTPRNFTIDPSGRFLLAANQDTGNVVVFKIDPATGKLSPAGTDAKVPFPVCITFLGKR